MRLATPAVASRRPPAPASAARGRRAAGGLIGSSIVPVNISRATPTTSATTITAAIGANGRLNTTLAGTDSCGARLQPGRQVSASPYQARALTRPATRR